MAEISLREYNREIESMVDSGRTDEAIAHARFILQKYPKHINSYRLLGKAYLEIQRYSDASDIFQRVLSSVPDDFVANLGMSIIREDEGNLDAAIWHMERAYEVQPSNAAIQAELKRLYGRRDGFEPPKIHLTRGALARMYAKGNLHRQAIGEVRAALAEGQQRPDLLVLLARMYQETGQRVEAVETCSNLINKLPDCMEANRILAEILPGTDRAAEAKIYQERLENLDPYASFTGPDYSSPENVPDSRISLEKYRWTPGETVLGEPEQREWAAASDVEISGEAEEEVPDWLASAAGEQDSPDVREEASEFASTFQTEEESLPDWLEEEDEPLTDDQEATPPQKDEQSEDLAPAEIPEWMQSMAPAEQETSETFDWPKEEAAEGTTFESKESFDLDSDAQVEVPDWLSELEKEEDEEAIEAEQPLTGEIEDEESPEWLSGQETSEAETEIPAWLQELEEEEGERVQAESAEPAAEALPEIEPEEAETLQEEVEALDIEAQAEIEAPPMGALDDEDAGLAWLESLAEKQGAAEEELLTSPEARRDTPPDWVQELAEEETSREMEEEVGTIAPADFDELEPEAEEEPLSEFSEAEAVEEAEAPEWLEAAEAKEESPQEAEELPDWLHGAQEVPPPEDVQAMIEEEDTGLEEMEAEMPEWLQEITEEDAGIPDWLQGFDETREEEIDSLTEEGVAPSKVQAEVTFEGQEDVPDWLRDLGEDAKPEVGYESEAPELPAEEIADEEEEPILGDTKPVRVAREEFETEPVELEAGVEELEEADELQEEDLIPAAAEQEEESKWTWLESLESREEELEQEVSIPEEELEQEVSIPEAEQAREPIEWIDEPEIEAEQAFEPSAEETEAAELVDELAEEMIDEERAAGVEEIEKPSEEVPSLDEEPEYEVQAEAPVQDLGEPEFLVDINSASLAELERIPGVGFTMAQNIIAHRETYGPFGNLDEIQNVTGIGPVTAEELKKWVVLESVPEEMPAPEDSDLLTLNNARAVLEAGDIGEAVAHYNQLIKDEQFIDEVVEDLQKAIDRHPMEIELYQALGDALMRKNQLQDALDIYTKAEELLR